MSCSSVSSPRASVLFLSNSVVPDVVMSMHYTARSTVDRA